MTRRFSIFIVVFLVCALAFSFVAIEMLRTYEFGTIMAEKNFEAAYPTDDVVRERAKARVREVLGYDNDILRTENPLVISSARGDYADVYMSSGQVGLLMTEAAQYGVDEKSNDLLASFGLVPKVNETLTGKEVPITPDWSELGRVVVPSLSNEKSQKRLEALMTSIEKSKNVALPHMIYSGDVSHSDLTSNDMAIAHQVLRESVFASLYPVLLSQEAMDFAWMDEAVLPTEDTVVQDSEFDEIQIDFEVL